MAGRRSGGGSATVMGPQETDAALARHLDDLERLWRVAQLELRRRRMALAVRWAPPVLADLVRRSELDLACMLDSMEPARRPRRPTRAAPARRAFCSWGAREAFRRWDGYTAAAWSTTFDGAHIGLGLRGEWLEVFVELADHAYLVTKEGRGLLKLDQLLPETFQSAMVGYPVERFMAHKLLFGSGMVVTGCYADSVGPTMVELDVGCIEMDLSGALEVPPGRRNPAIPGRTPASFGDPMLSIQYLKYLTLDPCP